MDQLVDLVHSAITNFMNLCKINKDVKWKIQLEKKENEKTQTSNHGLVREEKMNNVIYVIQHFSNWKLIRGIPGEVYTKSH